MTPGPGAELPIHVLRAATQVVDAIQEGLFRRGFRDVRPAHGFAFVRIAAGDATVVDIARHLGVSKQAASQLVEQLVQRGYLTREQHPGDGRVRLIRLTDRGLACTRAALAAAADLAAAWEAQLGPEALAGLQGGLDRVVVPGSLRPAW